MKRRDKIEHCSYAGKLDNPEKNIKEFRKVVNGLYEQGFEIKSLKIKKKPALCWHLKAIKT